MDQAAKLEPYLLLSKNAKGRAAADLIQKITAEPGVFAFSELLQVPGIQQVCPFRSLSCPQRRSHAQLALPLRCL